MEPLQYTRVCNGCSSQEGERIVMQTIYNIFWGGVFLWAVTILATAAVFNSTAFFFLVFCAVLLPFWTILVPSCHHFGTIFGPWGITLATFRGSLGARVPGGSLSVPILVSIIFVMNFG